MPIKESVKNQIREIIFNFLDKEHLLAFIFGSFAENAPKQSSDIDIGIFYDCDLSSSEILRIKKANSMKK
ncbi:MAG: nucleotidyltransferase domain-containing protein [Desulfobacterales bacterium]|nr:nucleotidyltransferase domain-containing protein [Desulfobacterales bacterium]